jgi:hypothetical protein
MDLVPRLLRVVLVASALAGGSGAALADGTSSGNGDSVALPDLVAPSAQNSLLPAEDRSSLGTLSQKFGLQSGHFDFFSVQPESRSDDFTSLLHGGGMGGGGLKFQLKW